MSMTQEQINADLFDQCKWFQAEVATLRAKSEAYDKGVEMWVVYSDKEFPITCSKNGESRAWAKLIKSYGNHLDWYTEEDAKLAGYTCRKVRVCEVVEQPNEKGER